MSRSSLVRAALGALVCGLVAWQPGVARANPSTDSAVAWPIASASTPVSSQSDQDAPIVSDAATQQIAQGQGTAPPRHVPLWRNGWDYTLDFSIAQPFGNT